MERRSNREKTPTWRAQEASNQANLEKAFFSRASSTSRSNNRNSRNVTPRSISRPPRPSTAPARPRKVPMKLTLSLSNTPKRLKLNLPTPPTPPRTNSDARATVISDESDIENEEVVEERDISVVGVQEEEQEEDEEAYRAIYQARRRRLTRSINGDNDDISLSDILSPAPRQDEPPPSYQTSSRKRPEIESPTSVYKSPEPEYSLDACFFDISIDIYIGKAFEFSQEVECQFFSIEILLSKYLRELQAKYHKDRRTIIKPHFGAHFVIKQKTKTVKIRTCRDTGEFDDLART